MGKTRRPSRGERTRQAERRLEVPPEGKRPKRRTGPRPKRKPSKLQRLRHFLARRQGWRCYYCGGKLTRETVTLDHLHPRSHGGRTHRDNAVAACAPCNRQKGDRVLAPAGVETPIGRFSPDPWAFRAPGPDRP